MSLEDKRESELMARGRHLGEVLVKKSVGSHGCPRSGALWSNPKGTLQLVFSHISKTRAAFVFDGETGNTDGRFPPLVSATCVCIHCSVGPNGAFKVRLQVSVFTSCLWAGWVLRCPNGPVRCCHSLSHRTDPGGEERQQDVKNSNRRSF